MAYKIFITHAFDDQDIYFALVNKLNAANRFDWRNLSIQFDMRLDLSEDELREEIGRKIEACDVLLALTKPVATRREWLQWEIRLAKRLHKPVIGIGRRRSDRMSSFVRGQADAIVNSWRVEDIVAAIRTLGRRSSQSTPQIVDFPPLVPPTPDETIDADAALVKAAEVWSQPTNQPPPKDVIFRRRQDEFMTQTVAQIPERRWWWPFARREH